MQLNNSPKQTTETNFLQISSPAALKTSESQPLKGVQTPFTRHLEIAKLPLTETSPPRTKQTPSQSVTPDAQVLRFLEDLGHKDLDFGHTLHVRQLPAKGLSEESPDLWKDLGLGSYTNKKTGREMLSRQSSSVELFHNAFTGADSFLQRKFYGEKLSGRTEPLVDRAGLGTYFVVNPTKGGRGKEEDVKRAHALFYEVDDLTKEQQWVELKKLEDKLGIKAWVVETAKSLHCYLLLDKPMTGSELKDWPQWQQRLIQTQGSDPAIHDLPRMMRLPGFNHYRWDPTDNPLDDGKLVETPVRIVQEAQGTVSLDQLDEVLEPWDKKRWGRKKKRKASKKRSSGPRAVKGFNGEVKFEGLGPWDIRNFAQYAEGYDPEGRKGYITCQCPLVDQHHGGAGGHSFDHIHIPHDPKQGFVAHCGCDTKEVYEAMRKQAVEAGHKFKDKKGRGKGKGGLSKLAKRLERRKQGIKLWAGDDFSGLEVLDQQWVGDSLKDKFLPRIEEERYFLGVKAPTGSGKTWAMRAAIEELMKRGYQIVYTTPLECNAKAAAIAFGLPYRKDKNIGKGESFACCLASLRKGARNVDWDTVAGNKMAVILDEGHQICETLRESGTGTRNILRKMLKASCGVITGDAGLIKSDVDLLAAMAEVERVDFYGITQAPIKKNISIVSIDNRDITEEDTPLGLNCVAANSMADAIEAKNPIVVMCSGQRGTAAYGTVTMEKYARELGAKTLRIDSQSTRDPLHPSFRFLEKAESQQQELMEQYDVLIASPLLKTGFSCNSEHFKKAFILDSGFLAVEDIIQFCNRFRRITNVIIGVSETNIRNLYNGELDPARLKERMLAVDKAGATLLKAREAGGIDELYLGWLCNSMTQQNAGFCGKAQCLKRCLTKEGHTVREKKAVEVPHKNPNKSVLFLAQERAKQEYKERRYKAPELSEWELAVTEQAEAQTEEQWFSVQRGALKRRFGLHESGLCHGVFAALPESEEPNRRGEEIQVGITGLGQLDNADRMSWELSYCMMLPPEEGYARAVLFELERKGVKAVEGLRAPEERSLLGRFNLCNQLGISQLVREHAFTELYENIERDWEDKCRDVAFFGEQLVAKARKINPGKVLANRAPEYLEIARKIEEYGFEAVCDILGVSSERDKDGSSGPGQVRTIIRNCLNVKTYGHDNFRDPVTQKKGVHIICLDDAVQEVRKKIQHNQTEEEREEERARNGQDTNVPTLEEWEEMLAEEEREKQAKEWEELLAAGWENLTPQQQEGLLRREQAEFEAEQQKERLKKEREAEQRKRWIEGKKYIRRCDVWKVWDQRTYMWEANHPDGGLLDKVMSLLCNNPPDKYGWLRALQKRVVDNYKPGPTDLTIPDLTRPPDELIAA